MANACPYGIVCVYLRRGFPNVLLRDRNQRKTTTSSYLEYMKAQTRKYRAAKEARIKASEEMSSGQVKAQDPHQHSFLQKFNPLRIDDKRAEVFQGVVAQDFFFWLNL
ncbi:hypothetical protein R1sor_015119 [Riccia sorocarpa]|uniref:Uncharacterized protein n=1 Tax=Riccia sorocarpa TaxID=122646 RepID=A0ABD3HEL9_9MARC